MVAEFLLLEMLRSQKSTLLLWYQTSMLHIFYFSYLLWHYYPVVIRLKFLICKMYVANGFQ